MTWSDVSAFFGGLIRPTEEVQQGEATTVDLALRAEFGDNCCLVIVTQNEHMRASQGC